MIAPVAGSVGGHSLTARAVCSVGIAGSMLPFPESPLGEAEWNSLLIEVRTERIAGLVWHAIREGRLPVTAEQAEQAEWLLVKALSGALVLERLLLETMGAFESAGVEARVLKGPAAAQLDYPDPSMRSFGDIDLLVRSGDFDRAVAVLEQRGCRRSYPQPRPGFDRRFSKGASFQTPDGLEVDLHRTLTMGPYGIRLDLARLWQRSARFDLAGRSVAALGREERFLHACYHAVLGETSPRLTPLRDAAQLALTHKLDLVRLHDLIRASRGEAVVAKAIRCVWSEFDVADVTALSAWAQAYRTDPRAAADLAAYGKGSSYASKSLAALRSLPSLRQRASFLYALLVPQRSYLVPRHSGRLDRLSSGLRQTVGARRAS